MATRTPSRSRGWTSARSICMITSKIKFARRAHARACTELRARRARAAVRRARGDGAGELLEVARVVLLARSSHHFIPILRRAPASSVCSRKAASGRLTTVGETQPRTIGGCFAWSTACSSPRRRRAARPSGRFWARARAGCTPAPASRSTRRRRRGAARRRPASRRARCPLGRPRPNEVKVSSGPLREHRGRTALQLAPADAARSDGVEVQPRRTSRHTHAAREVDSEPQTRSLAPRSACAKFASAFDAIFSPLHFHLPRRRLRRRRHRERACLRIRRARPCACDRGGSARDAVSCAGLGRAVGR